MFFVAIPFFAFHYLSIHVKLCNILLTGIEEY